MNGDSNLPAPLDDLTQCIDKVHAADNGTYIKQLLLQLAITQPAVAASLRAVEATFVRQLQPQQGQSQ